MADCDVVVMVIIDMEGLEVTMVGEVVIVEYED